MGNRRRSPEEWRQLIREQRSSGLGIPAFAQSRGLGKTWLYRWSKLMVREESDEVLPKGFSVARDKESSKSSFIELISQHHPQQIEHKPASMSIRLLIGSGVCMELSELPSPDYLAMLAYKYDGVIS